MMRSIALCIAVAVAGGCGGSDDDHAGDHGDAPADDAAPGDHDAAPGDDDGGLPATCESYCTLITEACVDRMRQYYDHAECLTTCALFAPGEPDDDAGNSLSCRLYHAELAQDDPDPHCYHAGPSGGQAGVCGTACENYCAIMLPTCPEEYADQADCLGVCAGFPDPGPYSVFESRTDTVACRIFHATRATSDDGHCGTASADSSTCSE